MLVFTIQDSPSENDPDTRLWRCAAAGDREAFSALVEKYQHFVYNTAYSFVGNRADADDIAQDTFLKAYRALSHFRGESKFSSWLYCICSNTARDFLRNAARHPHVGISTWEDDHEIDIDLPAPTEEYSPEALTERAELRNAVRQAISSLSVDHRQIILLRDFSGYSYEEIASLLHLSIGTVKSRINRARAAIRQSLIVGNFWPKETSDHQNVSNPPHPSDKKS